MPECVICFQRIGYFDLKYDLPGGKAICWDCMTCSVCGAKPNVFQGILGLGLQPFCKEHYWQAELHMRKPFEKWPDWLLESRLKHLIKYKGDSLIANERKDEEIKKQKGLGIRKPMSLFKSTRKDSPETSFEDFMRELDAEINSIQNTMAERKKEGSGLTSETKSS